MENLAVRAVDLRKHYGSVKAVDGVSFELRRGEIHALVGENGAGKSTFVRMVAGETAPDGGELYIGGTRVQTFSPAHAGHLGVAVIHQELNLVPALSVAENILLGHLPQRRGLLDAGAAKRAASEVLNRIGSPIDPMARLGTLTIGEQQMVEICKALARKIYVLILDEPTAALSKSESQHLFQVLRSLRDEGVAIIYISHRMDELRDLVDRVTVFRDGQWVATVGIKETNVRSLVQLMAGGAVREYSRAKRESGGPILTVSHLSGSERFHDITFTLRAGECLGIYGLLGAGQGALIRTLAGELKPSAGEIKARGKDLTRGQELSRRTASIGYVPSDRRKEGLVMPLPVQDNVMQGNLPKYARKGMVDSRRERAAVDGWIESLQIRPGLSDLPVRKLSGGNQQKVVLARWLEADVDILLLYEPTRGVDVRTRTEIYRLIDQLCASGKAVLVVTSDAAEVLALADRILIMRAGSVVTELEGGHATQEQVLESAMGGDATHE